MKSIGLRNVSDGIVHAIQQLAKTNRRSLQEQIKHISAQEANLHKGASLAAAAKWRQRLKLRNLSDTVAMVREDRER